MPPKKKQPSNEKKNSSVMYYLPPQGFPTPQDETVRSKIQEMEVFIKTLVFADIIKIMNSLLDSRSTTTTDDLLQDLRRMLLQHFSSRDPAKRKGSSSPAAPKLLFPFKLVTFFCRGFHTTVNVPPPSNREEEHHHQRRLLDIGEQVLDMLIELGVDLNCLCKYTTRTPLETMLDGRAPLNTIKKLVDAGAEVDTINPLTGKRPIFNAIEHYHPEYVDDAEQVLQFLLVEGRANPNFACGAPAFSSPLHEAVIHGNNKAMFNLIVNGADPRVQNGAGQTPGDLAKEYAKTWNNAEGIEKRNYAVQFLRGAVFGWSSETKEKVVSKTKVAKKETKPKPKLAAVSGKKKDSKTATGKKK